MVSPGQGKKDEPLNANEDITSGTLKRMKSVEKVAAIDSETVEERRGVRLIARTQLQLR